MEKIFSLMCNSVKLIKNIPELIFPFVVFKNIITVSVL
jgi:hypothetical protein